MRCRPPSTCGSSGPDVCRDATWLDTADGRLDRAGMAMHDVVLGGRSHIVLEHAPAPALSADRTAAKWPLPIDALPDEAIRQALGAGRATCVPCCRCGRSARRDRTATARRRGQDRRPGPRGGQPVDGPRLGAAAARRLVHRRARLRQAAAAGAADGDRACDAVGPLIPREAMAGGRRGRLAATRPAADLQLDGADPAARSVAAVLLGLLDVVEVNVRGVLADVDSEFLHDLRVAARSTRAIIKLTGDVLPDDLGPRFAAEWKWLTTETALTRDLDVQLLAFDGRDDSIDLTGLHDLRAGARLPGRPPRDAVRGLRRALRSARFRPLLSDWRSALTDVASTATGPPTTAELAAARMRRARRRAIRLSAAGHAALLLRRTARPAQAVQGTALPARGVRLDHRRRWPPHSRSAAQDRPGLPRRDSGHRDVRRRAE